MNKSTDSQPAISVHNVSKTFKLPQEKNTSIKGAIVNFYKKNRGFEKQVVLDDVTFEVNKGEFFGIVGRNGSGKSTLLKTLAGIYSPDKGVSQVHGKLIPFIELGVGFNPELTGRENVFLNGALLGYSRTEMLAMYDDIVSFAELGRFMDQRLKNYSSGMQVRLAFSIAIRAQGDILLLDEVLAVGDEAFQRKCYEYFTRLKKSKQTVILVTHDMGAVQKYCDRALMLESSKVIAIGKPREIAMRYEQANSDTYVPGNAKLKRRPNPDVKLLDVSFKNGNAKKGQFKNGDTITAEIEIDVRVEQDIQINFYIVTEEGNYLSGINTIGDLGDYHPAKGKHTLTCTIKDLRVAKGLYRLNAGIFTLGDNVQMVDAFDTIYGDATPQIRMTEKPKNKDGVFYMDAKWRAVS